MEYTLIRSKRKTAVIQIQKDGSVVVRAPQRLAKKEIDAGNTSFVVAVDNEVAVENLKRLAESQNYQASVETKGGNFHVTFVGDGAAAPRYIEARLSKFALDVVFNPKTTEWKLSYDGRNKEPITLPVKFPLLLAQGVEGIAVGLSSKILPHNFNELCDASISYLRNEEFKLYPDFQTGGSIDVSKYNDGERGGAVKIRSKINKVDNKTLAITEIPYGRTTTSVIDSILKAVDKGKIKIRKVDDNTAANVEILVHLAPGTSSDKTIDALYAFTDCEVSISPNCCVIDDQKPHFLTISHVLRKSADNTLSLLRQELEIKKDELQENLHFASLEKIFIEERIYKDKEFEQSKDMDAACEHIDRRLTPFYSQFIREVTKDDILRLMEIKMGRILKFNSDKAEEAIARMNEDIAEINNHLANIVEYTIQWYRMLKEKYGKNFPRRTELRNFDTIEAAKVVEANEKLYINREEGFIGTSLKKDEFVACCSDIDDVIIFYRDGRYMVTPVADKKFVGKNVIYVNVFKKNDKRTIYNVAYRDGAEGTHYIKRFAVTSIVRDREYDVTQGKPDSRISYFSANPNGEAEIIKVTLKPNPRVRRIIFERDFSEVTIRSRQSQGVILTRLPVHKIVLKQRGGSTLGGRKVWFDRDILRLNYDGRGEYLGEFQSDDSILIVLNNGDFYTTNFDLSNHYEDNVSIVEKFDPNKIWTAALYDADQQNYPYLKRFCFEASNRKQNYLGENKNNRLILLTDEYYPRLEVIFGGHDNFRDPLNIDADEFIAVKGFKAKGKRITTYAVETINELEPTRFPEPSQEQQEVPEEEPENLDPDSGKSEGDIIDEITGQMKLF